MKTSKLTLYIFLSLILGTLVGWQFPEIGSKMQPLAQVFLNMIKMVIAPLLFSVIVTGIATHGNMKSLGKLGIKTIVYFATATSFALVILVNSLDNILFIVISTKEFSFTIKSIILSRI